MSSRVAAGRAALGYLLCSLALFAPMLADPLHRSLGGGGGDPAQMMWFLRWTPYALGHGDSPFLTTAIDYPHGVSLLWNTSMPLAGFLLAPVTLTLGPVAAFNLLLVLGTALTAWACRWWLTGYVGPLAASVGGLFIGFSPFVIGQAQGHANFVVWPLVPVILRLLEDALWRGRRRPRRGILLGLAGAGQALLSEEVLLLLVAGALTALTAALLWYPGKAVFRSLRRAASTIAVGATTFLVLFGYPLLVQLFGPHRVPGLSWRPWQARPGDLIRPTERMLLHAPNAASQLGRNGVGNSFEVGSYLGLPLIALLVVIAVRTRRPALRVALSVAAVATLLSFGQHVHVPLTHLTLPGVPLLRLPALENVLPMRFALVTSVTVGWLVATLVQTFHEQRRPGLRYGGLAMVGLCLLPLVPGTEPAGRPVRVPAFFTGSAVQSIPARTPMLVLPMAHSGAEQAMLWQAVAGMRFRMVGGYALHPNADNQPDAWPSRTPLVQVALQADTGGPVEQSKLAGARAFIRRDGVQGAIVEVGATHAAQLRQLAAELFQRPPDEQTGGVWLWRPVRP